MTQDRVTPGDHVFSIEDRPLGSVTTVLGDFFKIRRLDGIEVHIPVADIYTVEHHRVTMVFSDGALRDHELAG